MPITMIGVGEKQRISRITGKSEVRRHLANLGFVEGEYVTIVSRMGQSVIVCVKEARIALDQDMANRIFI